MVTSNITIMRIRATEMILLKININNALKRIYITIDDSNELNDKSK